ncbi:MAG TPA: DNA-binding protein [Candidatus Cloacimonadota bacterium]|jgi:hypothetical protein|nr:DNA-binding protein [Candidatus Cloacimonadota bacterium]
MKATGYEPGKTVVGDDHCDNPTTVTAVTVVSNRRKNLPMLISRYFEHCDSKNGLKAVTVLLPVTEFYWRRLRMSKRKIRAVWLTVERVAELMNCSTRTVWRYVKRTSMMVHKEQIKQGSSKIMKSFLLTDPEIYAREMADCESRGRIPDEFIETCIEVDGRLLNSALVYKYRNATAEDGDYYATL